MCEQWQHGLLHSASHNQGVMHKLQQVVVPLLQTRPTAVHTNDNIGVVKWSLNKDFMAPEWGGNEIQVNYLSVFWKHEVGHLRNDTCTGSTKGEFIPWVAGCGGVKGEHG